jgi:hypothetical protein
MSSHQRISMPSWFSQKPAFSSTQSHADIETFKKYSILFKVKEDDNLNPPDHHRDRHPYIEVFRGLKFEYDAGIGQNGHLWMGTI